MRITSWIAVAALSLGLFPRSSLAYRERPFEWSTSTESDLSEVFDRHDESSANLLSPIIPEESITLALDDLDHRVNPLFQVPPELRSTVALWLRVYTQLTTQHVILFDEKHPEIIYDILDFRHLAETARSQIAYAITREHQIKAATAKFRAALRRLVKNPRPKNPTIEERKILLAVRKASHKHGFSSLAHGLRIQTGQRDNIVRGLSKADPLFNKMESIFASVGVPPELSRLVLVESSFDTKVVSRAGATGVWQFLEPSAREFLIVDRKLKLDERLSPIKSTVAAARLLKRNHSLLRDWGLAVTSYNSGTRPVLSASRRLSKDSLSRRVLNYCEGSHTLGFAGKSYFPSFLAILHAESYRELFYGRASHPTETKVAFIQIETPLSALDFGIQHGLSLHEFIRINPDVRDMRLRLPSGYWLAVPTHEKDSFGGLISENLSSLQLERRRRLSKHPQHLSRNFQRDRTTLMTSGETRTISDQRI